MAGGAALALTGMSAATAACPTGISPNGDRKITLYFIATPTPTTVTQLNADQHTTSIDFICKTADLRRNHRQSSISFWISLFRATDRKLSWNLRRLIGRTHTAFANSRSLNFWILPVLVFGISANTT